MSLCSSNTLNVKQFPNLNSSIQFFAMFLLISFLFIIPNATSLSFNFTSFLPNDNNMTYDRDTILPSYSNPVIQLTGNQRRKPMNDGCGRAMYHQPMQLYDKTTRTLTDFTTHFSFVINSLNQSNYADGFAFFLVPYDSAMSSNTTLGGTMCLTLDGQPRNSTAYPFVAVEFDIFYNEKWDVIPREHVGVDINSMASVANVTWDANANIIEAKQNEAQISYNSSSLNLSVVFTGSRNNTSLLQYISYIVDLRHYLPEKVQFGFSAVTGDSNATFEIRSWDFSSTLEIQENTQAPIPAELVVGLSVGGFALILVTCLISFGLWKKWKKKKNEEDETYDEYMEDDFSSGTGPHKYSYTELASAANNFIGEQKLGQGGFGSVYKGYFKVSNCHVAIKRISENSRQGIKEFASEVRIISRLRHRNLVPLIGWCHERKQLLLVYEYMPNRSLDFHLFKEESLLTWEVRYKIAQGLASALLYLHEECEQCVVHRDIKSSNIMLDSNFNARLGDFGLARLVDHVKGSQTTAVAGTPGYMAPECATTGRASKRTDVYSFGIVALEIACGRKAINLEAAENEIYMVEWVWELYENGRILDAADPRLNGDFEKDQMKCLMIVGLLCAHPDHSSRPSIRQAIQVLSFEISLPDLPCSSPVLTYLERRLKGSTAPYVTNAPLKGQDQNPTILFNTNSSGVTTSSGDSPSMSLLHLRGT